MFICTVAEKVPGIYRFCPLPYNQPSVMKFENRMILSQEGPHQGDPLGPLLFCLSIHPDLVQLKSELVAGNMDDLTLGGPTDVVAADIDHITAREMQTGLHINAAKCEIISHSPVPRASQFSNFIFLAPHEAELLGAPLFTGSKMDSALTSRCANLCRTQHCIFAIRS